MADVMRIPALVLLGGMLTIPVALLLMIAVIAAPSFLSRHAVVSSLAAAGLATACCRWLFRDDANAIALFLPAGLAAAAFSIWSGVRPLDLGETRS